MVKPYSACNIVQLLVCEKDILALEKFFQRISVLGFHCFAYTVRTYFLNDFFQRQHNNSSSYDKYVALFRGRPTYLFLWY